MITGMAALVIFLATIFYLVFPPCFVIWCFLEEWKWKKELAVNGG